MEKENMDITVTYYNESKCQSEDICEEHVQELRSKVNLLIESIDDMYKNIVTKEDIKQVKQNRECIEIVFEEDINFVFSWNKSIESKRVLIVFPIKESQDPVLIYLGNSKIYYSPLYVSSTGLKTATEIKNIYKKDL